ncbi:hypothetical protein B7R21_19415 [Subtercola boreus]|uniref:DUF262 domain-containing protein n=1 Tax=Subtercola boreus TaxID=120213 RepID=A0A3E0VA92_9MICO|nr:DUF262 domain-containing protein [Subtercola boreus]RFA06611.1 hypothetical protein B7R21_19415 [Subtercola boreus]
MSDIEAHEVPLSKVFSSDYEFTVPDFQRPYSWRPEQATQLLSDLTEALDRNDAEPYFLGSIVLVKDKAAPAAEVIDGQQRLTTITLLLALFRDLTKDPDLVDDFSSMILEPGKKLLGLAAKPRLTLRARDAKFFRDRIQTQGSIPELMEQKPDGLKTDSQKNLQANATAMWEELRKWSETRRFELSSLLMNRTFLVVVSTADLNSAHRIFSVMNSRGLDLSPADIFKAQVIGSLDPSIADAYALKWEDAEESLGRQAFADLFLHIRMIYAKVRADKELLKEFPAQVLNSYLPGRAAAFVDEVLLPYADAFQTIRALNYTSISGAEKVNNWIRRLMRTDNNDWVPVALWAFHHYSDDPLWLDKFLEKLERLATNMLLRRVYSTPRATRYANLLRSLDAGQGLESNQLELSRDETAEGREALRGDIYSQASVRKCVLLRLEEIIANEPGVEFNHKVITVEHVLPQHPKSNSQWNTDFSADEREFWTNRLGNLILLNRRKNSEAQNYDFAEKKSKYFAGEKGVATFALTIQVLQEEHWTPELLESRQETLANKLFDVWS